MWYHVWIKWCLCVAVAVATQLPVHFRCIQPHQGAAEHLSDNHSSTQHHGGHHHHARAGSYKGEHCRIVFFFGAEQRPRCFQVWKWKPLILWIFSQHNLYTQNIWYLTLSIACVFSLNFHCKKEWEIRQWSCVVSYWIVHQFKGESGSSLIQPYPSAVQRTNQV